MEECTKPAMELSSNPAFQPVMLSSLLVTSYGSMKPSEVCSPVQEVLTRGLQRHRKEKLPLRYLPLPIIPNLSSIMSAGEECHWAQNSIWGQDGGGVVISVLWEGHEFPRGTVLSKVTQLERSRAGIQTQGHLTTKLYHCLVPHTAA